MKKRIILTLITFILLTGCGYKQEIESLTNLNLKLKQELRSLESQVSELKEDKVKLDFLKKSMAGVKARIVTSMGNIELELFPDKSPIHCFNFLTRAESGFYDNTQFHRVIKGFMLQGGDPNTKNDNPYDDGQGGPIFTIPHEFNSMPHTAGVLSMARVGDKSKGAGSQFFVIHKNSPHLNNQYTVFGNTTSGLDVINKIAEVQKNTSDPRLRDRPLVPVMIKSIEVYR